MADAIVWPVTLGVLGAVFGSFIATYAIRWPQGVSVARGRSACDGCGRTLEPGELVPIVSFVALRGRCRTCGARIASSHLVIELAGAAIGVAAGMVSPDMAGGAGAVFGWLLLALGAVDHAVFRLPDGLNAALALTGIATGLSGFAPTLSDRLIGGAVGFASLRAVAFAYHRLRGRVGLGGGDAKLFGALGLWLGWRALPPTLLIACIAGLVWAVVAGKRSQDRLPLGTLLAAGGFAMWLACHWPGGGSA